jgi:hypothetical protein
VELGEFRVAGAQSNKCVVENTRLPDPERQEELLFSKTSLKATRDYEISF